MINPDYFGIADARDLFSEIQKALGEYTNSPSFRLFFFLAFGLNHLREWIAGCSMRDLKKKVRKGIQLNPAEHFAWKTLWDVPEFRIINSMCNRGKHCTTNDITTTMTAGFEVGTSWCGDALDQNYYTLDGIDSRECFYAVTRCYGLWFEKEL